MTSIRKNIYLIRTFPVLCQCYCTICIFNCTKYSAELMHFNWASNSMSSSSTFEHFSLVDRCLQIAASIWPVSSWERVTLAVRSGLGSGSLWPSVQQTMAIICAQSPLRLMQTVSGTQLLTLICKSKTVFEVQFCKVALSCHTYRHQLSYHAIKHTLFFPFLSGHGIIESFHEKATELQKCCHLYKSFQRHNRAFAHLHRHKGEQKGSRYGNELQAVALLLTDWFTK